MARGCPGNTLLLHHALTLQKQIPAAPAGCKKKIERVLRDVGLSRTQAKAFMAGGYSALSLRDAEDVGSALNALKNLNF